MFAVLSADLVPGGLFWPGGKARLTFSEKPRYVMVRMDIPIYAKEGRIFSLFEKAMRTTRKTGASGVVLPTDFPYPELAYEYGLEVWGSSPLFRKLAAPIAQLAAEESGIPLRRTRISLLGSGLTPEMLQAAQILAPAVGGLYIDAGDDTEAAGYLLRSRYGISCGGGLGLARHRTRSTPENDFADENVIHILFDKHRTSKQHITVLAKDIIINLTEGRSQISGGRQISGAVLEPPRYMWKGWPTECDSGALLFALLSTGQINLREIAIRGLRYSK